MQALTRRVFLNLAKHQIAGSLKITPALVAAQNHNVEWQKNYVAAAAPKKQKLLRYPAFPLDHTITKFLKSVEPLLTKEELEKTKESAETFVQCDGKKLQELLEKCASKEENWLAHRWLRVAYMQFREPVTVYSSPSMSFPLNKFKDENDYLLYAAKVVYGMAKYKKQVDNGEIPVVKLGKNELDNSQFGLVYGTCRIPKPGEDEMCYNPKSDHIAIIYKNHFYKMHIFSEKGVPIDPKIIACEFQNIIKTEKENGVPIGILTTDHRDNWADAYECLMKIPGNKESIQEIQSCLFTVSLDQKTPLNKGEELNAVSEQLIYGGGSKFNSANRWMDKTIQLVVNPNGISGYCYEHSPAEGQPVAIMADYVTKNMKNVKHFEGASMDYDPPKKLPLRSSQDIDKYIKKASANVDKLAARLDINIIHFQNYGKEFMKSQKFSPDSFIQIALQYAFFKLHGEPAAQYESAHLRIFTGGRTETIRSCSNESVAFAKAMCEGKCSDAELIELLRKAVNGHREYTTLALQGKGVDRHLLGLKQMAIENDLPIPAFYKSPGYVKSLHFRVSTSQVATPFLAFMSYGPMYEDGYACCYNPRECDMILAVTSWRDNKSTDSKAFGDTLSEALDEMAELCQKAGNKPTAKL